ncbi:uncharacterized protein LOC112574383 [Pomacea canaliculata]|uniref:uncharacterized protein LOC112574383 n=1 Tax=Pomacea canaliculata TaxID=400727 RepID=UPI000D73940A|nr:uncharacterized protein LOC112574383 [Pomacea canaliculata]
METSLNPQKSRFEVSDDLSDVTLEVEGRRLYVNKILLMIHSPVFNKMFTADFKEKCSSEIPLPGKKFSTMVELLEQIYPGDGVDLITDKTLPDLLELADEYDMQHVFHNAKQYIIQRLRDPGLKRSADRTFLYLGVVERYKRLDSLRNYLVWLAACIPAEEMEKNKFYHFVPATAIRDALLLRHKAVERFIKDTTYTNLVPDVNKLVENFKPRSLCANSSR